MWAGWKVGVVWSRSSLVDSDTAELLNVWVVAAQRVKFVVKVVVEGWQLVKADAVTVVREQIAEVQSASVTSRVADAWQLTCQRTHSPVTQKVFPIRITIVLVIIIVTDIYAPNITNWFSLLNTSTHQRYIVCVKLLVSDCEIRKSRAFFPALNANCWLILQTTKWNQTSNNTIHLLRIQVKFVYAGHRVIGWSSRSQEPKKHRKSLLSQCKTSASNTSSFIKHRALKFARSMGFSDIADRHHCNVTRSDHT